MTKFSRNLDGNMHRSQRQDGSPRVGGGTRKGLLQNMILSQVLKSLEVLARQTRKQQEFQAVCRGVKTKMRNNMTYLGHYRSSCEAGQEESGEGVLSKIRLERQCGARSRLGFSTLAAHEDQLGALKKSWQYPSSIQ